MKQCLFKFVMLLFSLVMCMPTGAQSKVCVGYCDGKIATSTSGNITGVTGSNATINMAIRLPKETLAAYKGCEISGVNWGVPSAPKMPAGATSWARTSLSEGNIAEGTVSTVAEGWNEITFASPLSITDDVTDLYIGISYQQTAKLSVISYAGDTSDNGCYCGKNGDFTSYADKGWGSLSIEAVMMGNVATHDLQLLDAKAQYKVVKLGNPITISATVKNNASATATNPVINYTLNGTITGSYTIDATLAYRDKTDVTFSVPTTDVAEPCTAVIDLRVDWPDGTADDNDADNQAAVTTELASECYVRQMVVEEATGSWCGYCVRGIVGLRTMTENHHDDVICIAVHNNDDYAVNIYDTWMGSQISGYPSCIINRDGNVYDPSAEQLETYYQQLDHIAAANLEVSAKVEGTEITFTGKANFMSDETDTDYRIVFVVLEDQCLIVQSNYYAGGTMGEMGGFENMASKTIVYVDDVARGIYPSPKGESGSIASSITKGEIYEYKCTATMPTTTDGNSANVRVVAMLIDGKTGACIQGARAQGIEGYSESEGISAIVPDATAADAAYDLLGRRISQPVKGSTYIANRQLHIYRGN